MKQCPRCPREYADDLNFCLEDGATLVPKAVDDKTWILPEPVSTITAVGAQIEPGPTVATPTSQPSRRGLKVLLSIGIIFGLLLIALLKIAPWSEQSNSPIPQNTNVPVTFNFAGSPTPTNSPTPATTPIASPIPTASLVAEVSPTPLESIQPLIQPGVYGTKFQPTNKPEDALGLRTIRIVFTLKSDGSYIIEGYVTLHGTDVSDKLYQEERGRYTVTTDRLMFRERIARNFDFDSDSWKTWAVPGSGSSASETIRNITARSFQLYSNGTWLDVLRLY